MLTLRDVVRQHLGDASSVALAPGLTLPELERQLQLLDGVTVSHLAHGASDCGPGTALVAALGSDPDDDTEALLGATSATTVVLLLGSSADDVTSWPRALSVAGAADAQVVAAVPVQGDRPLVLVLRIGQPLTVPAPYLNAAATPADGLDERRLSLRIANELTLVSLTNDALLSRLEHDGREHHREVLRLRAEVAEARKRADAATRKLSQLQASRSFRAVSAVARLRSRART